MKAMKGILMGLLFVVVFTMGCSYHWGYDRDHRGGYGYGQSQQQEGWSCP